MELVIICFPIRLCNPWENLIVEEWFFNGKYYHGTIKEGIAELCDDPVNQCRLSMLVKVKTQKIKIIQDGGDSQIIVIDGEILKDYTKIWFSNVIIMFIGYFFFRKLCFEVLKGVISDNLFWYFY